MLRVQLQGHVLVGTSFLAVYVPTVCRTYSSAKKRPPILETHWLALSILIINGDFGKKPGVWEG